MANSYSTSDCVKGALQRVGELTDGTSPLHQLAIKYVNQVHKDVINGNSIFSPETRDAWKWARQTAAFTILPNYNTGSVSLTQGSTSGIFSTAPTISLAGYFIVISGRETYYKIASHIANSTSFTLDLAYVESTGSAMGFNAIPLIYDLGARIQRLVEPFRIYKQRVLELGETATDMGRIYGVDVIEFWKKWPLQLIKNDIPSKFTVLSSSDSSWKVQFNKYVSTPIRVDYDYIPIVADLNDDTSSIPLIPRDNRDLLEIGAAYYLYTDKKQLADAQLMFQAASAKIVALRESERSSSKFTGDIYGQLVPRLDDTAIPYWVIQR